MSNDTRKAVGELLAPMLNSRQFPLTKPNTSGTITEPATLRSDCCSLSLRNAVI
jgi:hypothetical protein